jgi:tetratricopeptide (TPR) repeat protein
MKPVIAFLILILAFSSSLYPQVNDLLKEEKPENPKALEAFIEGKTFELQDNYIAAFQKYYQALSIEKAPGIYYTLSRLYYNLSQYKKALETGLEALKLAPGSLDYKENLSDIYIMLNDYRSARKYLLEIAEKKPDDINILYNIGRMYEADKQPSEAIKYYEKITEDYEYDEIVLQRMIEIYEGYKDYANSAAAMEKLLSMNPSDINLKYTIAATYLKIPDYDNALRMYDEILNTDPNNREVQTEMIKIYFRQHRTDLAFEKFGKLMDMDTVNYDTKMNVALSFFDAAQGDPEALGVAKSILENVVSAYPGQWMPKFYLALADSRQNNSNIPEEKINAVLAEAADTSAEAYIQVGFYYYEENKLDYASILFKKGVSLFSEDFRLNFLSGNTLYRLGREKESLPYLEKALKLSPQDLNTISTLGIIYDNLNMDTECESLYEQAFKYYPDNILLLNNYAYHLAERGIKLKEAEQMSKKTIEKEPENASYLDTYGWICFKLKDYKNAEKYIKKAISFGSNAVILEHLGDIYEAMEEIPKALKAWKQALELDPDNKDIIYKIEKYK